MKIAFSVNCFWFLTSHRLALVHEARRRGWETHVLAGPSIDERDERAVTALRALGCELHTVELSRSGRKLSELRRTIRSFTTAYRAIQPDLVHQITPKVVILGSISARRAKVPALVNAISGLGFMFSGEGLRGQAMKVGGSALYAYALSHRNQVVIVQNERDLTALRRLRLPGNTRFVRLFGSGVDLDRFRATPIPTGPPTVVLPARMLRDKGVLDFAEAGRILGRDGVQVRMVLCGPLDAANPAALTSHDLAELTSSGAVEWWGQCEDMPGVLSQATVVALPSYYAEGLPLALAEAAAAGRAIVTTNMPGCCDTVVDGESGTLVPPKDARALASAIADIVRDPARAAAMGHAGRRLAERQFALQTVVDAHFEQYEWLHSRIRS